MSKWAKPKGPHHKFIENIKDEYIICTEVLSSLRGFKLTVGTEELKFNDRVQDDTMFIDGRSVITMADEATHFWDTAFICI